MQPLKITEDLAKDITARIKTFDFGTIEKLRKAEKDNGTFDVIISTEDVDRAIAAFATVGRELGVVS